MRLFAAQFDAGAQLGHRDRRDDQIVVVMNGVPEISTTFRGDQDTRIEDQSTGHAKPVSQVR